jgi:hypothetical protein
MYQELLGAKGKQASVLGNALVPADSTSNGSNGKGKSAVEDVEPGLAADLVVPLAKDKAEDVIGLQRTRERRKEMESVSLHGLGACPICLAWKRKISKRKMSKRT